MPEIDSVQGAFTSKSQVLAAPRRFLHPAWVMLGIGTLGMFLSAPGQSFSVAAFIDPMLGDLRLLRTDYSIAYLIAGLVGGALLPGIGLLLDRLGARVLLPLLGLLLGLLLLYLRNDSDNSVTLVFLVLVTSFMVSYLRSRGEGLGIRSNVGLMQRPERVVVLAAGFMVDQVQIALGIILILSTFTIVQRFWHLWRETKDDGKDRT